MTLAVCSIAICAADTGQLHWSAFHHRWTLFCVSLYNKHLFFYTQIAFSLPAVLLRRCGEFAPECCHLQPVLLNQLTTKLISVSLIKTSPAHRILGVRDMGSNFYPFTAARNGNKLVTKGLFSKLPSCLLVQHAVRLSCCVTLPQPPNVLQKSTDMLRHIAGYVRHPIYCGLGFLTFGLCAITGSQARLALSVACWILLHHQVRIDLASS